MQTACYWTIYFSFGKNSVQLCLCTSLLMGLGFVCCVPTCIWVCLLLCALVCVCPYLSVYLSVFWVQVFLGKYVVCKQTQMDVSASQLMSQCLWGFSWETNFKWGIYSLFKCFGFCLQVTGMHFIWDVLYGSCIFWFQFLICGFKYCWRRHPFTPRESPTRTKRHHATVWKQVWNRDHWSFIP